MKASFYFFRLTFILVFAGFLSQASALYDEWKHSGSTYIVTDSAGADLPASAVEKNFPLLVRLNKEYRRQRQMCIRDRPWTPVPG